MPPKRDLGSRGPVLGVPDSDPNGGFNPYLPGTGWDVIFTPQAVNIMDTEVECYHISLDGPVGSVVTVLKDNKVWDYADGWANGWDPSEPMLLQQTSLVQFAWNVAATAPPYNRTSNIQPTVTLWLRLPESGLL